MISLLFFFPWDKKLESLVVYKICNFFLSIFRGLNFNSIFDKLI